MIPVGIGKRIKEAREKKGLTQEELGRLIGVTGSAITNYEKETSHPKEPIMYALIEALCVDANFLFQDCVKIKEPPATPKEMEHIKKYRSLDDYGKEAVDGLLDVEYRRCSTSAKPETGAAEPETMVEKLIYLNPAAAGTPLYAESDFERISFPANEVPPGADFGIRISGRSMEPTIMDGSIVWVHKEIDLGSGEVGVFMLNDAAACKRYFKNDDGTVRLESDNPEFDPVQVTEFDTFVLVGRVVGAV